MCVNHSTPIDNYYCSILRSLQQASAKFVPKIPFKSLKAYWNSELDKLKEISLDMHKLWRSIGSPKTWCHKKARLKANYDYKMAIKRNQTNFKKNKVDELN